MADASVASGTAPRLGLFGGWAAWSHSDTHALDALVCPLWILWAWGWA